ncbi:discoidin domain-containing protein [Streptomyces sp. NBC_01387]|uniref:discoidin domain-containing protein n=1 Tax=unclassified Streptomyces TaxID=2593676 RepID=UPI002DDB9D50|nr:discoidin domain-containing protein [Streptomyces sp. NBC_01766]WSC23910.1 discoidin domain-containing protein [Streptomyces sp. NBC_01766]WSV57778.1 discoidin domain-containing protein [Streptomyces sp. NBC_01014]
MLPDPAPDPAPTAPARTVTGTVRCPNCRTENSPDRTLCVRCALLLNPGPPPGIPLPWWRRIFRRRPRQALTAGTRPRRRLWRRPSLALPLTLVVLACAVWFALPHLRAVFGFAEDETGTPESMPPAAYRSSSAERGHPAAAAFDGFNNRYWAPKAVGPGTGEFVECDFDQPVRLLKVIIFSGTSAKQDEFLEQARPAKITVLLTTREGKQITKKITLADQPGQQTFDVHGSKIVRARLTTDAAYGTAKGHRLAIAEIEFFGHRS